MRVIEVQDYQCDWPRAFDTEQQRLINRIPLTDIKIYHIGSTAVPGLAAKPIIDILLEVSEVEALDQHDPVFLALGYECKGEHGIAGRRYYQKGGDNRSHQIHAFNRDSVGIRRHLAFRDYLIAHPQIAQQYGEIKRAAAFTCKHDINKYCQLKHDFVVRHEALAMTWRDTSGQHG
jgi:GrpB-like predicted nucleotidyltransferase (UPF0157 family)